MVRPPSRATRWGGALGAKTGLLVYADGDVPELLRHVGAADLARTTSMMRQLYPGREIEVRGLASLGRRLPPEGNGLRSQLAGRGRHR